MRTLIILLLFGCLANAQDGYLVSYMQGNYNVCTADPNEQNTTANATSDPNCNEIDGYSGWSVVGAGSTIESQESDVQEGGNALKLTAAAATTTFMYTTINATSGDTFTVTYWMKTTQTTSARSHAWTNVSGFIADIATTSWVQYTQTITATATGDIQLRFYASANTSGVVGDNIIIDNLSIIKTN